MGQVLFMIARGLFMMVAALVITMGALVGGLVGFNLLMPPPSTPEDETCGLVVMPAVCFGFPVGLLVGGCLSLGIVLAAKMLAQRGLAAYRDQSHWREDDVFFVSDKG
jgi:hypothetical protein